MIFDKIDKLIKKMKLPCKGHFEARERLDGDRTCTFRREREAREMNRIKGILKPIILVANIVSLAVLLIIASLFCKISSFFYIIIQSSAVIIWGNSDHRRLKQKYARKMEE